MSAAYKVQYIIQKTVPTPFAVDLESYLMTYNILHQKRFHKLFRYYVLLSITTVFIPTLVLRIIWLFWHWKSFTVYHVDQIVVYIFFLAAVSVCLPAYYLGHSSFEIQYMFNQRLKLKPNNTGLMSRLSMPCLPQLPLIGKYSAMELFICGLFTTFIVMILGVVTLPFAISYEPIQLVFQSTTILVKIFASMVYIPWTLFAATSILSALLLIIVYLEGIIHHSFTLYLLNFEHFSNSMALHFKNCYRRYRMMYIFIILANEIILAFITNLIFVGILLATCGAFMSLKMYTMLNIIIYALAPATTALCFVLALLLTKLANIPYRNSQMFKTHWTKFVRNKGHRKLVHACVPIGFLLGPYGLAKAKLGLNICDDIIRNTVTLLLLGGH